MRVLVLNASYEPLCLISWERAIVLMFEDAVDVVEGSGKVARSPRTTVEIPSVIRMRAYVHVSRSRRVGYSRQAVLRRDGHRCAYCNRRANTIDHVTPRCRGGRSTWENTVAACGRCNHEKAARTPIEAGLTMLVSPREPSAEHRLHIATDDLAQGLGTLDGASTGGPSADACVTGAGV